MQGGRDSEELARLKDHQRTLASIRREISVAQSAIGSGTGLAPAGVDENRAYARWEVEHGPRVRELRSRVDGALPNNSFPSDPEQFVVAALILLDTVQGQLASQTSRVRADIVRRSLARDELDVALRQRTTIDNEVARVSSTAGSQGAALAELTSFIAGELCPVCDRNFSEVSKVPLSDHVHMKVRTLSASAERLLVLGRTRSELQIAIERLQREIEAIAVRSVEEEALADFDRRQASVGKLITELQSAMGLLSEGTRLRAADIAARRAVNEVQARHVTLAAAYETLSDFARLVKAPPLGDGEAFEVAAVRLEEYLAVQAVRLEERLSIRRNGVNQVSLIRSAVMARLAADAQISEDSKAWERADQSLKRAQALRDQGNAIRTIVDGVRSSMIRREFNDRLNRVWRDLFVRLAPGELFVPAFRIPESSTQNLQPKLVTEHRDGGEIGGTPGAMLSMGNLNTAALTLFIALHLSVPKELPWLLLDDPVQSMDDVHIAHFAALLRTLSKEHGRQVMIAVHDRQLFEYLKLELSPAFADDSLLTLELSRGPRRDSVCVSKRYSFRTETALLAAA